MCLGGLLGFGSSSKNTKNNRLLPTPTAEGGCGYSKAKNNKIVGGSDAPVGRKNFSNRKYFLN